MLALVAIALATAVLPPAGAWWLNTSRIVETRHRAGGAAARVRARLIDPSLPGAAGMGVACGPGSLPDPVPAAARSRPASRQTHESWLAGAAVAPELFGDGMPTDAWGRCFLVNVGASLRGNRVWVLSAGPNGLIETPMTATALEGDDIGAVIR